MNLKKIFFQLFIITGFIGTINAQNNSSDIFQDSVNFSRGEAIYSGTLTSKALRYIDMMTEVMVNQPEHQK